MDKVTKHLKEVFNKGGDVALLKELNKKDYGEFTLGAIGEIMGITRERVRQIEAGAIKKLKHPKMGRGLKHYVEMGGDMDMSTVFYGRGSERKNSES